MVYYLSRYSWQMMTIMFLRMPITIYDLLNLVSVSVPTNYKVPAFTPSGRSIVSIKTNPGLFSEGISFCTPPESAIIK